MYTNGGSGVVSTPHFPLSISIGLFKCTLLKGLSFITDHPRLYEQAQESMDDRVDDTATTSAFDGDEDEEEDHDSSGEEWKRGGKAATSTGNNNETELLHRRVEVMKREARTLYSSADKKGALTKLRECKAIEHELAVDRALNTARGLAAPPVITPSSPPEKIMTTEKVLSDQPSSSSNSASEQQNIQQHQDQQEQKQHQQPQSGQAAAVTSRELKIKAVRMHRAGDKAKAIALIKQAKSIENRLLAQVLMFTRACVR